MIFLYKDQKEPPHVLELLQQGNGNLWPPLSQYKILLFISQRKGPNSVTTQEKGRSIGMGSQNKRN
jgi:hypothetical protein